MPYLLRSSALVLGLACSLGASLNAGAQTPATAPPPAPGAPSDSASGIATLPPVSTELTRSKDALPYKRMNELLSLLARHGEGLFRMGFDVDLSQSRLSLAQLRMAVRSDEADRPINFNPSGHFYLPILPAAEAENADIATNVPKADKVRIRGALELTTPAAELDLGQVRRIVRVADHARSEILPWYLRWYFPTARGVKVCSSSSPIELRWREAGQLVGVSLPLQSPQNPPDPKSSGPAKHCATLTGQEGWPDAAKLHAGADARPEFIAGPR